MNTEFIKTATARAKINPGLAVFRGLSVSAIVWLYATFATQKDVTKLEETNKAQWRAIAELRAQLGLTQRTNAP